ncbi:MAG: thioredoxin [Deltaproteobacteria bacterium]|nr:MAG: thioredoxin [Deltaproteobacteria bacterium]
MLRTNLKHVQSTAEYNGLLSDGGKAAIVCGRMGPMCIPVYGAMEALETKYPDVKFFDMEFDAPVARETIRRLPEVQAFYGLPFTVYLKGGKIVHATGGIQSKAQVKEILDHKLA